MLSRTLASNRWKCFGIDNIVLPLPCSPAKLLMSATQLAPTEGVTTMDNYRHFWEIHVPRSAVEHLTPEQKKALEKELFERVEYGQAFEAILKKYELVY